MARNRKGGENGDSNRDGNGKGRPAGAEPDRERQKERQAQAGRAAGSGDQKSSVGGGCVRIPGVLQGGRYQLGPAPTTSVTAVTRDWSRR